MTPVPAATPASSKPASSKLASSKPAISKPAISKPAISKPTSPRSASLEQASLTPAAHPDFAAEQAHLDLTVRAMLRQIDAWEDRDRNTGADLETSLLQADNSEEFAAMLSPHVHRPYVGSLNVTVAGKNQTLYVGRHGFRDLHGPGSVVSWESNLGALFYSGDTTWATPKGLQGHVHRRRQLNVAHKTLTRVTDLYDDAAGGDTGGREAVLLERLSEGSGTGVSELLATLQPEQSAALRAEAGRPMILQGTAGSGKTTVAFHRLAWLIHPERGQQQARAEHCLVLMPNQVLARYAAQVLPSLGLEGVRVTTPEQWAQSFLQLEKLQHVDRTLTLLLQDRDNARRRAAWRRAKLMGDLRMLEVLRRHLHARILANVGALSYRTTLTLGARQVPLEVSSAELHASLHAVFASDPLGGLRPALLQHLTALLLSRGDVQEDERPAALRQLTGELNALTGKLFTGLLPVSEARRLLNTPALLAQAAQGLMNPSEQALLLSDPLEGVAKPRGSHADITEWPLMLAVAGLIGGLGRQDGFTRAPYDEITVDEAQDVSPLLYALLARAVRPGHVTALGDLTQGISGFRGPSSWADVQAALPGAQVLTLHRSYRSTREISDLAARVAATYSRVGATSSVERHGEPVLRYTGDAPAVLCARAVRALLAAGHRNVMIITRRVVDAVHLEEALARQDVHAKPLLDEHTRFEGGVVLIPTVLAKGLETDACVLMHADAATYDPDTEYDSRLLFVGLTRGLHALALVAEGELHPLLQP